MLVSNGLVLFTMFGNIQASSEALDLSEGSLMAQLRGEMEDFGRGKYPRCLRATT